MNQLKNSLHVGVAEEPTTSRQNEEHCSRAEGQKPNTFQYDFQKGSQDRQSGHGAKLKKNNQRVFQQIKLNHRRAKTPSSRAKIRMAQAWTMKISKTSLLGIAAFALIATPVDANSYYKEATIASQKIKEFDPEVRNIKTIFGKGAGVQTKCGPTTNSKSEAFYCGSKNNGVIVFSKASIDYIGSRFGRETVQAVVSHEYGHARQHAVQGFTSQLIWTNSVDEIQADCIAGVYMATTLPKLTEEKLDQVSDFFKVIGDYIFFEKDWHGTPQMRSASFRLGYRSGDLKTCLAANDINFGKIDDMTEEIIENAPEKIDDMIKWGKDILK